MYFVKMYIDCVVVKPDFPYMLEISEFIFWSINIVSKDDGNWVLCRKNLIFTRMTDMSCHDLCFGF